MGFTDLAIPSCAIIASLFKLFLLSGASVAMTPITVLLGRAELFFYDNVLSYQMCLKYQG